MASRPPRLLLLAVLAPVILLAIPAASHAGAETAQCTVPPTVTVDNDDPATTTVTITVDCQAQVSFRRIITATAGGAEILRLDTSNTLGATSRSATSLTLPKAQVCIEDPDAGSKKCIPA